MEEGEQRNDDQKSVGVQEEALNAADNDETINAGDKETKSVKRVGLRDLNYRHQILDEICLEGLDGITLQALWLRLKARSDFTLGVDENSQSFIWQTILVLKDVQFYKLSKSRDDLTIHDRYKYIDGELGIVVEPNLMPADIYPFCLVDDTEKGVKGSCASYETRILLGKNKIDFEQALSLGNRLVLVGSQKARYKCILGPQYCPLQAMNITIMQWALLERIGRARYQGEITQGNLSLQFTNENPKTLFYHRKSLVAKGFLTKQVHHQKTLKQLKNLKTRSQNSQGTLFHLPRFYVERQPKALILVKKMIEYLKKYPTCMATYEDLKAQLNIGGAFKKLLKTHEFLKYMQGDVKVPYRTIYPEATPHEWRRKGMTDEKMLRVVKLSNTETTPEDVFNNSADNIEKNEDYCGAGPPGVLDQSNWMVDRSVMWQAYHAVEEAGPNGISQQDLGRKLGHGKLEARTICRNLMRRDLVITVLDDRGRQRVTNFVAKKYETESRFSNRFQEEKARNRVLTAKKVEPESLDISEVTVNCDDMTTSTPRVKRRKVQTDSNNTEVTDDNEPSTLIMSGVEDVTESTLQCTQSILENDLITPKKQSTDQENTANYSGVRTRNKSAELSKQKASFDKMARTSEKPAKTDEVRDLMEGVEVKIDVDAVDNDETVNDTLDNSDDAQISMSISSDFQLNDKCKSPLKKRDRRMENQSSLRQLQRVNTIIEAVRHYKVIDDPTKLFKMIQLNEQKEGYPAKMDKKSLLRILGKLGRDGQIKNITVNLQLGDKDKNLHFVCEPHIDESNTVIQSAIEQAKMKFNSYRISPDPELREMIQRKIDSGEFIKEDTPCSGASTPPPDGSITPKTKMNKRYGLQPKFVRMRELHMLLFYLSRDYAGDTKLDQIQALKRLQDKGHIVTDDVRELSKYDLYMTEPDWRMFVPPLPVHSEWKEGWCLMCDVLLRLPLSIFVKLVHITMEVPGLQEYLCHPVKQHMLIRNLPSGVRNKIMHQRKYIFTIHEVATRLAYIGVIQFGPQKLKEKDQVFLYVNKNTCLMDTTSSLSGYHQVESGRTYPVKSYHFTSLAHVERYWYDMWEICISTPLGESSVLSGQEITVEFMDRKPEMLAALEPRQNEEADAQDDGHIPGDGLGAAGLDSSIFAHLKRNWSWNSASKRAAAGGKHDSIQKPPFCIQLLQEDEGVESEHKKSNLPTIRTQLRITQEPNKAKENRKRKRSGEVSTSSKIMIKEPTGRPSKIVRVIAKRKTAVERKPYYDEKDKAALRLMRKLRVDWTAREDSFLLLCKAAGMFIRADTKNQMVQYTSVRDLLHKYFPESCNKTSRACQRRLNYMMKNQTTMDNVNLFLADLQQDESLKLRFNLEGDGSESKIDTETRLDTEFGELVHILITKKENASSEPRLELPDTIEEIKEQYNIFNPGEMTGSSGVSSSKQAFQEPTSIDDIHCAVINTLVVSSLCCASDKRSWTFQLFKIYQQYPDTLLRKAMTDLRDNKMVSLKKHYNKTKLKQANYLPLSSSPYQLSVTFAHSFLNRYQYDIYSQSWDMVKLFLRSSNQFTEIKVGQEGGYAAAVTALLAAKRLSFRTEVPEQLVVLDPNLSAGNQNYIRILERYKELLRNAGGIDQSDIDYLSNPAVQSQASGSSGSGRLSGKISTSGGNNGKPTCTTLFSKSACEERRRPEEKISSSEERELEKVPGEKRVTGLTNQIVFQEGSDARSNTALAKSASRIALYMMREEIRESPLDSRDPVQHSHDFFVISSCKLEGRMICLEVDEDVRMINYSDIQVPLSWLPGDVQAYEALLDRYGVNLAGLSKRGSRTNCLDIITYVPLVLDPAEVLETISKDDIKLKHNAEAMLEVVDKGQVMGVTRNEMLALVPNTIQTRDDVITTIQFLVHTKLIIPVGIVDIRWVCHKYCRDWLIHTYRVTRVKIGEKLESAKFSGKLYQGHGPREEEDEHVEEEGLGKTRKKRLVRRRSLESSTGGEDIKIAHHREKNPQMAAKVSHEVSDAAKKINWDDMEEILVQIRPWVRIEGSLNRRVLDRLLGAVLGAAMQYPGSRLYDLAARFSPALQPVHAKELIHMLTKIKAVTLIKMTKQKNPGLWSKPEPVKLEEPDLLDSDQEIIIEASVDAILLLGQFIGNKVYTTDFACQCPCHPDRRM